MRQWFLYILFVTSSATFAEAQQTHNSLTLDQAIINVLERSPVLKAADYEAKAAAARIRAAQLSPAYKASIEFENFAGSDTFTGADKLESTLSLSKVLELGDKARLRGDVAQNESTILRNEQDAQRLDLLAETTKRFIHIVSDQEQLKIAKSSLALAERTHKVVERRVKAGKAPNVELRRAKITLAHNELKVEHARHELATSRVKLTTLWGQTQVDFTTAEANLFAVEPVAHFEKLVQLLERNPELVRFATEKRLAETRLHLARSARSADIEVVGGLRYFNNTNDTALVMSLNIPLGSSSRASSKVEEAELMKQRSPHEMEQRRLELHATLFELYQEINHSIDAVDVLRKTIIPQAEQALQDYEKGYAAGRYSFLELTEAQRTLLDSKLEAVLAAADYHRFRSEIDRLTGASLSKGVNP